MAYFGNSDDGICFEAHYCERCYFGAPDLMENRCPIMFLHFNHNGESIGKDHKRIKGHFLDVLIEDTGGRHDCKFFIPRDHVRIVDPDQTDMFKGDQ